MTSIEKLLNSLGEPNDDNGYVIKSYNNEWWIEHKVVNSAEPLSQWLGEYFPQQEISDEEIEEEARQYTYNEYKKVVDYEKYDTYNDFINGAKWYREQLKQRQ